MRRRGERRRGPLRVLRLAVVSLALLGCKTPDHVVRVSALRDPSMVGRTYWLVPGAGIESGQLEFRAFQALVDRALSARGYVRVDEGTEPHLVVRLSYGVGPPLSRMETRRWAAPGAGGTRDGEWTYRPGRVSVRSWTEYTSWLEISASHGPSYLADAEQREVWRIVAYTDTQSRDLRAMFPVLLASAMDYIGRESGQELTLLVPLDSARVQWLRSGGQP